jgi:hypothetical protein
MSVIRYDFGKKDRDSVRRFTQLTSLEAQHEAKVLANPLPYLERANERISTRQNTSAWSAAAISSRRRSRNFDRTRRLQARRSSAALAWRRRACRIHSV